MTTTPEERAQLLIAKMIQMRPTPDARVSVDIIAQAIREAEDAAIERARREIQMTVLANIDEGPPEFLSGLSVAAERVSALKHNKD